MLEYKGYFGTVEADDGVFVGRVSGLRDVITFEGATFAEVERAFRDSIDDYLVFCARARRAAGPALQRQDPASREPGDAPPGGDTRSGGGHEPQSMDCTPDRDRYVNPRMAQRGNAHGSCAVLVVAMAGDSARMPRNDIRGHIRQGRAEGAVVNFARVLKEVLWRLVTEGSISYRRIKRGFGLDDDALEDLRRELIGTLHIAADVDGELLVWAPEGRAARPEPMALPQPLPALRHAERPACAAAAVAAAPEAERRQLTVMFCDLVGSTALSTGMDPEDLRDVIASFQNRCSAAIRRYDGFVAKYMGDGILVYFGYPRAHEDEAERSVRAGLDIVDAMAELNAAIRQAARGRARGADRHRHRTGDRRRPDRRRNGIGDRGRRRDAEPGGASAGIGAAEPDRRQRGHARDARRSLRPRGSGGL